MALHRVKHHKPFRCKGFGALFQRFTPIAMKRETPNHMSSPERFRIRLTVAADLPISVAISR
jgi:hypothetical protein